MKVVDERDDFASQEDFVECPDFRDCPNDRVKYRFVVPSEDPAGNLPTDVVWKGEGGHEYTVQDLLALVQEMRLGRAADMYGNTTATPVQPAAGTDLGDDGDEAIESSGEEQEEQSGSASTSTGDFVWT